MFNVYILQHLRKSHKDTPQWDTKCFCYEIPNFKILYPAVKYGTEEGTSGSLLPASYSPPCLPNFTKIGLVFVPTLLLLITNSYQFLTNRMGLFHNTVCSCQLRLSS